MDTPSNKPPKGKSWPEMTRAARQAAPPGDIDVRFAVRRAIETDAAKPNVERPGLFADLVALSRRRWFYGLLGGGALAMAPLFFAALQTLWDLLDISRLGGPMLLGL